MMVIAIGPREQISRVLPELGALLRRPLLTVERVRVCKRDGQCLARPRWRATVQIRARARGLLRILGVESCVAENEEESPWPALQTEFGLAWEDSAVTAMVIRSCVHIEARHTTVPEQLATDLAGTIVRTGALIHETASGALVLSPEPHGRMVQGRRAAGRVRAGRPRMVRAGRGRQGGAVQPDRWRLPADHPDALPVSGTAEAVHVLTSSETVLVVVAGAANAEVSAVVETFGPRGGLPPVVRVGGPAPSGPD
jgi:hypothetical protein